MGSNNITNSKNVSTTPTPTKQLKQGITLEDRYLIRNVIGLGGMGAVYGARDLHFPNVTKIVAVKEMVNQASDPRVRKTIVQNFEREANLLATLDHPAIPSIYDYFTENDRSYLILEYIKGKDLENMLNQQKGPLPKELVIRWGIELCDVLHFLHNHKPKPIIFRDMKPSNVMINQRGHIILIDFGIAKPFQAGQKGTMIGTEGYSPPEQYRGEATLLADIYALGATLHHLLTNKDPRLEPPFTFDERPIDELNPDVSPELVHIINKALEYEPEDRYQNAKDMKDYLGSIHRQSQHTSTVFIEPPTKTKKKDLKDHIWKFDCEDEIRGTPTYHDGVVYVGSYDNNLYALDATSGEFLWKYPSEGGIVSKPAVYNDNVYFGSEDGSLHVVDIHSGKVNWTFPTDGEIRSSPYIAEGHIFIGSDDANLYAINTMSTRCSWKMNPGDRIRSTPLVSADSVYIGAENGDFYCLDFKGNIKWRYRARRAITSSPIVHEGVVYFCSVDSTLYALDVKSGWVVWQFRLGKASISTPAIAKNKILTGSIDGHIYCIDLRTSKKTWLFATDNQVTSSPIVFNNAVYFGSVDSNLYSVELRTGNLRWKLKTGGPITGTPAVTEEMVFIGSTDNHIYAVAL